MFSGHNLKEIYLIDQRIFNLSLAKITSHTVRLFILHPVSPWLIQLDLLVLCHLGNNGISHFTVNQP